MSEVVEIDVSTGEETRRPLTDGEQAARDSVQPDPEPVDRLSALEARIDAAAALAEQANATAQDVAAAMKPAR